MKCYLAREEEKESAKENEWHLTIIMPVYVRDRVKFQQQCEKIKKRKDKNEGLQQRCLRL